MREEIRFKRQERFIEKAKQLYGNKYDYSKVKYVNSTTKVCIVYPGYGEFWMTPELHLRIVNGTTREFISISDFISKSNQKYNNKFDYSKMKYVDMYTKICIICPEHGEFWQTPSQHLYGSVYGCPECANKAVIEAATKRLKYTTATFIEECKRRFPNQFTYEETEYVNWKTNVILNHNGEKIKITPNRLLHNHPILTEEERKKRTNIRINKQRLTTQNRLIQKAKEKFGDQYDYSEVNYVNQTTPVTIISKKYGKFQQTLRNHIESKTGYPNSNQIPIYTLEFCKNIAKKYNTLYDFAKSDKLFYQKSKEKNYLNNFTWFNDIQFNNKELNTHRKSCVYIYKLANNVAYIGLTNNLHQRHIQHCTQTKDPIRKYCTELNKPIPEPEILVNNITKKQSGIEERKFIQQYKNNGWILLNKNDGGATGHHLSKYSDEFIINYAKNFKTPNELELVNPSIYQFMYKNKLQTQCFPNSEIKPVNRTKYTPELVDELVKQYQSKNELRQQNPPLHTYLFRHGLLYKYFPYTNEKLCHNTTERDKQILELYQTGKKAKEIASIVNTSRYTVQDVIRRNSK